MGILIREAVKSDSGTIAKVVLTALGDIDWVNDSNNPKLEMFRRLASRDDSQYSYRNCHVCEVDGVVAGAICTYDGANLYPLREALFEELDNLGEVVPDGLTDETEPGELYIDSLAVFEEYRGQGLAKLLIAEAFKKAKLLAISKVGLIVDIDNPKAEKLYKSLGFRPLEEKMFLGHQMRHMQCEVL